MSLKKQLLEKIKNNHPEFDETEDVFEIEFAGTGGQFWGFTKLSIWGSSTLQTVYEGPVNMGEDFLFSIVEESGVDYNWNDAGTEGTITYNSQEEFEPEDLWVSTLVKREHFGIVD